MHLIKQGYRFIPLYNIRNDCLTDKTGATLFVKVKKISPQGSKKPELIADQRHSNGLSKTSPGEGATSYLIAVEE